MTPRWKEKKCANCIEFTHEIVLSSPSHVSEAYLRMYVVGIMCQRTRTGENEATTNILL